MPSTSLVALRGERARATIGTRVRLTLLGAGRVSVLAATRDGDIELALDGGRLLVDYHSEAGGTLRVRSPGAITTVVGTLFAVEAMGQAAASRWRAAGFAPKTFRGAARRTPPAAAGPARTAGRPRSRTTSRRPSPSTPRGGPSRPSHRSAHGSSPIDVAAPHEPVRQPVAGGASRTDLDVLYARAEAAMRERSLGEARRALETIATRDPRGPLGEAALLDLARLALADGDRAEARRVLARLPSPVRDPALAETAAHLRCRAQRSGGDDGCDAAAAPRATR